jgi:hypothetical protein
MPAKNIKKPGRLFLTAGVENMLIKYLKVITGTSVQDKH